MSQFVEIDGNDVVLRTIVATQVYIDSGAEEKKTGRASTWVKIKASHFDPSGIPDEKHEWFTKRTYDEVKDKFINPSPFSDWVLDADDEWQPPSGKEMPDDGKVYSWDTETSTWIERAGKGPNWTAE